MADYGLVTEVTAPGQLDQRVAEMAQALSHRSPVSFAAMKTMAHQAQQPSWEQTLQSDLAFFRHNWNSDALREGLRAHAAGQEPHFAPPSQPTANPPP